MALKDCKNTEQSVSQPEEGAQKDTQGQSLTRCLTYIARSTELLFQKMLGFLKKPYKRTSRRVKNRSLRLFQRAGFFAERCYAVLTTPYRCCKRFGAQLGEIQGGKAKTVACFRFAGHVLKRSKRGILTLLNYLMPVAAVAALILVVHNFTSVDYAIAVSHDGQVIGYIEHETTFDEAQAMIQQQIVYVDSEQTFDVTPEFSLAEVQNPGEVIDETQLANKLISCSNEAITQASGLYVDGKFYGATTDRTSLDNTLNSILEQNKEATGASDVAFMNEISIKDGLYLNSSVVGSEELTSLLTSDVEGEQIYTVEQGDSMTLIANKTDVKYSELKALNPEVDPDNIQIGQPILIANSQPFLSVKATKEISYQEQVPHQSIQQEDASLDKGVTKITQEGVDGVNWVAATLELVNGIEVNRTIKRTEIAQEPVSEIKLVGTKVEAKKPANSSSSRGDESAAVLPASSGNGTGIGFIHPLAGGQISCGYSSGHPAIDWRAPAGTNIYAAASGRVILAKTYSTYGKCVIIDHGNGVQTLYAHQSKINVQAGQQVSQGQVIGFVGSTGYSTGNHLHFEVRVNNVKRNPLSYVN